MNKSGSNVIDYWNNKISYFSCFRLCSVFSDGAIKLPVILSDGVILPRDTEFTVNGWASPGESVT